MPAPLLTAGYAGTTPHGLDARPTTSGKAGNELFAVPLRTSPAQAQSSRSELSDGARSQRLQDADATMGRPLFLGGIGRRDDSAATDLLHHVAGKKPPTPPVESAKPPVKPEIIVGPDGKPAPAQPQKTAPEVGITEPLPPTTQIPDPELGCAILHERCEKTCEGMKLKGRFTLLTEPVKNLCYGACAGLYSLCRLSGSINNSQ